MGLLNDFLSAIDNRKRVAANSLKGLLADPVGHMGLLGARYAEQNLPTMREAQDAESVMPGMADPFRAKIENLAMNSGMLGIVSPQKAMTLNTRRALPQTAEFSEAVANTPSAAITPDGLMMRLQRNQMPEQALEDSVRGGVFYLPEGAAQAKHYSTGRTGYGGLERIKGETLIQNPLLAKGGTGGKVPERAYDSLLGKGSYQKMRDDALNTQRWAPRQRGAASSTDATTTAQEVEKFLAKYAPEMAGKADYIVDNSQKGNQLAYALQEAAVASAARRAGHDAILGYSKGKSGNFLSEVFDLRESHYPDKFGTSRTWPDYER